MNSENNDNVSLMLGSGERESSTSSSLSQNKKKRTRIDSRGSNHLLPEQSRHLKTEKEKLKLDSKEIKKVQTIRTQEHYRAILTKLEQKCAWHAGGCCILDKFTAHGKCDYNAVYDKIEECQEIVMFKDNNSFLHELFRKSIKETYEVDSKKKFQKLNQKSIKFVHEWKLHDGTIVCSECFKGIYGFSKHSIETTSEIIKQSTTHRVFTGKLTKLSDARVPDFSYNEVKEIFEQNGIVPDDDMIRATLMPFSDKDELACVYLEKYFENFGDSAPDREEVHLLINMKTDVYLQYKSAKEKLNEPFVQPTRFNELWNNLFPQYINRPWCDICGKCNTCYLIDRGRRFAEDTKVQAAFKKLHALHRGGMFMLERMSYKARINDSLQDRAVNLVPKKQSLSVKAKPEAQPDRNPVKQSIIADIMDQNSCRIPYCGTQDSFDKSLHQIIVGVKEHGEEVGLYRTIDTVSKSSNLITYCILSRLERFNQKYGRYPEILYLQIDGGSENANKSVLAMLELLVIKRICHTIYYTRLPAGHTHEDIDACFGIIWATMRGAPCETLSKFKELIEDRFKESKLNAHVYDVYLVPDYAKFLEGYIDSKFAKLHKEMYTQLQWRFEAVARHEMFPLGCKVTYRAYSSAKVIEFVQKPKKSCHSELGVLTGLEPVTTYVKWYPDEFTFSESRPGIEGYYILKSIPVSERKYYIDPMDFPDDAKMTIDETISSVWSHFNTGNEDTKSIIDEWTAWKNVFAPLTNNAKDYISQLNRNGVPYHSPLKMILFDETKFLDPTNWVMSTLGRFDAFLEPEFAWPEILAAAMASVSFDLNPHPPAPRLYVSTSADVQEFTERFENRTVNYYEKLSSFSNEILKDLLRRQVGFVGSLPSVSLPKNQLIDNLRDKNIEFLRTFAKLNNSPNDEQFMTKILDKPYEVASEANMVVSKGVSNSFVVTKGMIRQFCPTMLIRFDIMNCLMLMLQIRDKRIIEAHTEVNKNKKNYKEFLGSIFCNSVTCSSTIQPGQDLANHINGLLVQFQNLRKIHKIYIPFQSDQDNQDDWKIVVISPMNKEIHFFNPRGVVSCEIIDDHAMTEEPNIFINDIKQKISQAIDDAILTFDRRQDAINQIANNAANIPFIEQGNVPVMELVNDLIIEPANGHVEELPMNNPVNPPRRRRRPAAAVAPAMIANAVLAPNMQITRPHQWKCDKYPALFCPEVLINDFDSGVACFLAIYMIAVDCPIVLTLNELSSFRRQIAYWLLIPELPC